MKRRAPTIVAGTLLVALALAAGAARVWRTRGPGAT